MTAGGASCNARMAAWSGRQKSTQSMTCWRNTLRSPNWTSKIASSVISIGCGPCSTRLEASGICPRTASTSSVTSKGWWGGPAG
eukprot:1386848-Alexandrium_andersonii.AAC.1